MRNALSEVEHLIVIIILSFNENKNINSLFFLFYLQFVPL